MKIKICWRYSIIFYRFDAFVQSVTYLLRTSFTSKRCYLRNTEHCVLAVPGILAPADLNCFLERFKHSVTYPKTTSGNISYRYYLTFAILCHFQKKNVSISRNTHILLAKATRDLTQNRDLKQTTTATAARTPQNKRFNEQNNGCARAL